MKATMTTGDQVPPAKLASKESAGRKEAGPRTPSLRFDDVLSGFAEAASRGRGAKEAMHRTTEPMTKLAVVRPADALPPEPSHDIDAILGESTAPVPVPSVSVSPAIIENPSMVALLTPLAVSSRHTLPPLHVTISRAPAERPTSLPAVDASRAVADARVNVDADVSGAPLGRTKEPVVIGEPRVDAGTGAPVNVSPTPARRPKEPTVNDGPRVIANSLPTAAGQAREQAVTGGARAMPRGASRVDLPLALAGSSAVEPPLTGAPPIAAEVGAQADMSPEPMAFPTASSRDPRNMPILATRPAVQMVEQVGTASDRVPSGGLGKDFSVVGKEKHFQPTVPPRESRFQPAIPATDAPRPPSDRTSVTSAVQATLEEHNAAPASRVETQLRPVPPITLAPVQQVAAAVAQEIGSAGPEPLYATTSWAPGTRPAQGQEPLRILKVALEPPELGRVTIRLRLTGRALDVTVTAERAETASALDRDRHLLSKILTASGYSAEDIKVHAPAPSLSAAAPTPRGAEAQPGNQAAPPFQPNGSAEGERQQSRHTHDGGRGQSPQETQGDEADSDPRRGSDLYV